MCQARDRRCLKQSSERQLYLEGLADVGDELGSEEGVSTELEEVIVDADAVNTQDVAPYAAQHLLLRGTGGDEGGLDIWAHVIGSRQCTAVDLGIRGKGQ